MRDFLLMQKCASVNLKKWRVTPHIWVIGGVIFFFTLFHLSGILDLSRTSGVRISPWIFPHFFALPIMQLVYGFLTVALFSDAPFRDGFSQFMEVRVGKKNWIRGQVLYIVEASFLYALYYVFVTLLISLPRIFFTWDWGQLMEYLAYGGEDVGEQAYQVNLSGIFLYEGIVRYLTPVQAMVHSFCLLWLVSVFLGMLVFTCHILLKKGYGIIAAGFFVFLSYFCNYVGWMMFGTGLLYVSPVNWISLGYLNVAGFGGAPDISYAYVVLTTVIFILGKLGVTVYCRQDSR